MDRGALHSLIFKGVDDHDRPDDGALQRADHFFRQDVTFVKSVPSLKELPTTTLPEMAFIGRSNVGKSSLINGIFGRRDLARTSNTPGRTQLLNFFNAHDRLMVVDLPGYGYAKAPKDLATSWNKLVRSYLRGRVQLRRVYILIDSRHGIKKLDDEMMDLLDESAVSYQVVLTKADKIGRDGLATVFGDTLQRIRPHVAAHPHVLASSAAKGWGVELVRWSMVHLLSAEGL